MVYLGIFALEIIYLMPQGSDKADLLFEIITKVFFSLWN